MAMTIVGTNPDAVIGGVDTHAEVHVAAAVNHVGGVLGVESFPTTRIGYRQLVSWLATHGELTLLGVEGTGSYGVGLARYLARAGIDVVEVDRPTGKPGTAKASPIRWTQSPQLERRYLGRRPACPRAGTATWKRSGC